MDHSKCFGAYYTRTAISSKSRHWKAAILKKRVSIDVHPRWAAFAFKADARRSPQCHRSAAPHLLSGAGKFRFHPRPSSKPATEKNSGISKLRLISFEPVLRRTIESDTEMLTKCFNLGVLEPSKYTALAYPGSRLCLSLIQDQLETEQPT